MTLTPRVRKFALSVHLTVSVGWIGAVMAYLALVVAAMISPDAQALRSVWLALALIGWYVIVPLSFASLVSGIVMSLGTPWGLFRYYWVLFSLALTSVATVILFHNMSTVSVLAAQTSRAAASSLRGELLHAGLGLVVLLVIQELNVYKPRAMTPYR